MTTTTFPSIKIKGKQIEYKTVSFLVKSVDQDQGIVTGLASPMQNVDHQRDQVEPGAYTKTLAEAQARMDNGRRFMYATLWMHNPEQPTGGMISGEETAEGLLVTMKYDISTNAAGYPNNPIATMVFSGFKVGYIDELSIGYIAIKYDYDKQGVRHLREIQLLEISGVTMLFAANPEALVLASGVKSMVVATKGASGKTTWPLASRTLAWDGSEAHNAIVKKATKDDGSLDQALMKSVHFWYDESAPEKIGSYKLLFCDVIGGDIKAVPRGIFASTGGHGLAVADIPESDVDGVKKKIASYYKRMAKEFDDETIVVPWSDDGKATRRTMARKDFTTLFQAAQAQDALEDWGDLVNVLTQAMLQAFCMGDEPGADMTVALSQFGEAVGEWTKTAVACNLPDYLGDRYGYGEDNAPYVPYSMRVGGYDYSSRHDAIAGKAGATISAATQGTLEQHQADMKESLGMVMDQCKSMQEKVSSLTHLWQQQQGNNQQDDGKALTRREPPPALSREAQPLSSQGTADAMTIDEFAALLA